MTGAATPGRHTARSVVLACAVLWLVACGPSDDWPTDARRYIPDAVQGAPRSEDAAFAASLARSIGAPGIDNSAFGSYGAVKEDDAFPRSILLAFAGPPDAVQRTLAAVRRDLAATDGERMKVAEIDDLSVSSSTFRQGDRSIAFADVRPRPGVALIALSFSGQEPDAIRSVEAMLATAG